VSVFSVNIVYWHEKSNPQPDNKYIKRINIIDYAYCFKKYEKKLHKLDLFFNLAEVSSVKFFCRMVQVFTM